MLEIFNDLKPFFEDNYLKLGVREYARLQNISPPTASVKLKYLEKKGILKREVFKNYLFFKPIRTGLFLDLQISYYKQKLQPTINKIKTISPNPPIVLFGSTIKGELNENSDIDIAIFSKIDINIDFPKKLQIFQFKNVNHIKNEHLLNNMINGVVLSGEWNLKNV